MTPQEVVRPEPLWLPGGSFELQSLLGRMVTDRVSDVHLQVGSPPRGRIDGDLCAYGQRSLTPNDLLMLAKELLSQDQWDEFEYRNEMDVAYSVSNLGRFRCNLFRQRGSVGIVMRVVSDVIQDFEQLGLPSEVIRRLTSSARGLVLVTGPTGSGKSTTLASMIDEINTTRRHNIITIEDPIEVLHHNKRSLVVQREVGFDTQNFAGALKYAMRQDPDVIMIGEMRDKQTVEAAITAAQTGHLVFSTLHTLDALRSVNRILDFFSPYERDQIRVLLADSLVGIVSQRLLRREGGGRVLGTEMLLNTPLIQDYIRDPEKTPLIKDALVEGALSGMHTFDQSLVKLVRDGVITTEVALESASSPHELRMMLTRTGENY